MKEFITNEALSQNTIAVNKMISQTYTMVGIYFISCAAMAGISYMIKPPSFVSLITLIMAFILMFLIEKNKNNMSALPMAIGMAGLLGFGLGPTLNNYLSINGGSQIVMTSFGLTAMIFFGLTAYVMTTKKDFSFMGGALAAGSMIAIIGIVGLLIAGFMGVNVSGFSLALSGMIVILMTGFILYDTSNIVNGVYTNYITASVGIFLSIYNLFISLLNILGALNSNE